MKKKNIFFWFLLFILLTTYQSNQDKLSTYSLFQIKEIKVEGVKNGDIFEIEEKLKIFKGKNILTINIKKLIEPVFLSDFIKDIKINRIYPDKIKMTVEEYNPIGVFLENGNKNVLIENGKLIKNYNTKFDSLPLVHGINANEYFPMFYKIIKNSNFDIKKIDHFTYFESDRWDIQLKDGKLIKLPSGNRKSEDSFKKFLSINEKENFKRFKVFDFRTKNQLIIK